MTLTRICGTLFLCMCLQLTSQERPEYGKLSKDEADFTSYPPDTEAHAVVLYERGDNYFEVRGNRIWLIKDFHTRIKVMDQHGFEKGTISIPYYKGERSTEKVEGIRAMTHNGVVKTSLKAGQVFTSDLSERLKEKKFTFPNIKPGSILEYTYTIVSPFFYHFNGWSFQSDIPKVYSEFNAKVPGNYVYNRNLSGSLKLFINEASTEKHCFRIDGFQSDADCEVLRYAMKNVPAFKKEAYMLGASNYISRIDFELSEYHRFNGTTDKYTKTWEDVDHEFKTDRDIGRQLTKRGFFEKNAPPSLLTEQDPWKRAEGIYKFVRDRFSWNGKYGIYNDIRVREAFEEKKGNVGEINISLINMLNAAGINTQLMLTSTREHGLPKRTHPVMSDFNYVIARATIGEKIIYLDASDKFVPFGMLPFRCLNYYGRVMDFEKESFWEDLPMDGESKYMVRAQITFDENDEIVYGVFDEVNKGYDAVVRQKSIAGTNKEVYLNEAENRTSGSLAITNYAFLKDRSDEEKIVERFECEFEGLYGQETIYLDPIFVKFFNKELFLAAERHYPVDFGHRRNYTFLLNLILPDEYEITEVSPDNSILLPDNAGVMEFSTETRDNILSLRFNIAINQVHFNPDYYPDIKSFFRQIIEVQDKSTVILTHRSTMADR